MNTRVIVLAAVCAVVVLACNEVPVRNLTTSYQVQIQELRDRGKPAKLDVLWVIDDSPSMCQEQQALATSFRTFLEVFQRFTSIDMRVAVTSTNVCVKDPRKPDEAVRGKFLYSPATAFPPDCVQSRAMVCNSDADCRNANLPDAQNWVCTGSSAENLYTCDVPPEIIESTGRDDGYEGDVLRSVQSECRYRCSRDNPAQCARVFGSSDACAKTSVGANPSMCDGGTCSTDACISNPLLKSSVDCNSACRGQECTSVCEDLIGDAAACASRCTASSGSCIDVCQAISKTDQCAWACSSEWNCQQKCEGYLYDSQMCAQVCAAGGGAACRTACTTQFKNQDFLCSMICDTQFDCTDRCIAEFGGATYRCLAPGGDPSNAGCMQPPPTTFCPKNGPKILDTEIADQWLLSWMQGGWDGHPDWDSRWKQLPTGPSQEDFMARETARNKVFEQLFICMATIGADQVLCGNQEQGLRAAWMALDPEGENADQSEQFLRDDAYLLVVVVSDEDDCSAPDYCDRVDAFTEKIIYDTPNKRTQCVIAEDVSRCSCLRDENGCLPWQDPAKGECDISQCMKDGQFIRGLCPLESADAFVNKIRSLKKDPAQVVFAAIAGDIMVDSDGDVIMTNDLYQVNDVDALVDRYFTCKCDKWVRRSPKTYGCLSSYGKADLGLRYNRTASAFGLGRFGQLANICNEEGIGGSLEQIANLVVPLLTKVCLPRPMEWSCQAKCISYFNDSAKCEAACSAIDCFEQCQIEFDGELGCSDICSSGESLDVFKYDASGTCMKTDAGGNCLPLVQGPAADPATDYFLVKAAPECVLFDMDLGERPENAIQFTTPLEYSDRIEIVYRTKPFYCQDRCNRVFKDNPEFCNEICSQAPDYCLEGCIKDAEANRCAYVCTTSPAECIQQCELLNSRGATYDCNRACRDN